MLLTWYVRRLPASVVWCGVKLFIRLCQGAYFYLSVWCGVVWCGVLWCFLNTSVVSYDVLESLYLCMLLVCLSRTLLLKRVEFCRLLLL